MTNRSREIFDFAQMEPLAVLDMQLMLEQCDEEEIGHIEQVADNVLLAIRHKDQRFMDLYEDEQTNP